MMDDMSLCLNLVLNLMIIFWVLFGFHFIILTKHSVRFIMT